MSKVWLAIFAVSFVILGYFGSQAPSEIGTIMSRTCTVLYFAFFLLMPFYTRLEKTKPVPERVTG
jgi:ubiquinol-cytochrome c reductase cytochrome b subunit